MLLSVLFIFSNHGKNSLLRMRSVFCAVYLSGAGWKLLDSSEVESSGSFRYGTKRTRMDHSSELGNIFEFFRSRCVKRRKNVQLGKAICGIKFDLTKRSERLQLYRMQDTVIVGLFLWGGGLFSSSFFFRLESIKINNSRVTLSGPKTRIRHNRCFNTENRNKSH